MKPQNRKHVAVFSELIETDVKSCIPMKEPKSLKLLTQIIKVLYWSAGVIMSNSQKRIGISDLMKFYNKYLAFFAAGSVP